MKTIKYQKVLKSWDELEKDKIYNVTHLRLLSVLINSQQSIKKCSIQYGAGSLFCPGVCELNIYEFELEQLSRDCDQQGVTNIFLFVYYFLISL